MTVTVRYAETADYYDICDLLLRMHVEVGLAPLDQTKMMTKVRALLGERGIIVAVEDGKVIGTVGFSSAEWWFSKSVYIGDFFNYVVPEARTTDAAEKMVLAMKALAKRAGMPLVMGIFGRERTAAKDRWLGKYMRPVGSLFMED